MGQAMTTNKTIDGVPREAVAALEKARDVLRAIIRDKAAGVHYASAQAACHQINGALLDELRALLDAPAVSLADEGGMPGALPQGEPVAYDPEKENKLFEAWARTQSSVSLQLCDIGLYYQRDTGLAHDAWQYRAKLAEQPAPVAVVMPERMSDQQIINNTHWSEGWNACLDEVTRLNAKR